MLATGPLPLEAVAAAKSLAHWLTTGVPLTGWRPLLGLLLNLQPEAYGVLVATMLAGTPAVSFLGAIGAALTLRTRRGGLLLALLMLPLFVPTLIFGIEAIGAALSDADSFAASFLLLERHFAGRYGAGAAGRGRGAPIPVAVDRAATNCAGGDKGLDAAMQTLTQRLANPTHFMALSARLLPWCWGLAAVPDRRRPLHGVLRRPARLPAGPDRQDHVRPRAGGVAGDVGYALVALSSFGLLVFRHPLADVSAKAAAPHRRHVHLSRASSPASLWGKPMWGAFWVWDPRLTSVLILFFLYLGLIALRSSIEDEALAAKLTAVLSLVGIAILPVIKFSVEWNSLHQPASVMRLGAPTIHPSLLWPLLVMAARHDGAVRRPASQGHAQRDPAPAREGAAHGSRCRRRRPVAAAGASERHGSRTARRLHLGGLCASWPWCWRRWSAGWCSTVAASSA